MSSIGTGYDDSTGQFSPDGRVFQIEYAQKAVENSGTAIALKGRDGVVFAVEKIVTSNLYETGANKRIFTVGRHIGIAVAGLLTDARQIVETAKMEAANYLYDHGISIPIKYLKDQVATHVHMFTLGMRPFGASILLGSYENDEADLFCIDPSGTALGYYGCAIGKAKQAAETEMEKLDLKKMSCKELIREAAKIIYVVHDEVKDKNFKLELSWVCQSTGGKHEFVPPDVFEEAETYAKEAVEDDSEEEDM